MAQISLQDLNAKVAHLTQNLDRNEIYSEPHLLKIIRQLHQEHPHITPKAIAQSLTNAGFAAEVATEPVLLGIIRPEGVGFYIPTDTHGHTQINTQALVLKYGTQEWGPVNSYIWELSIPAAALPPQPFPLRT